jgi:hypothetical protein
VRVEAKLEELGLVLPELPFGIPVEIEGEVAID